MRRVVRNALRGPRHGELALEFQAEPNAADAQVVADGLLDFLAADLGTPRREPFALVLRRQDDSVAGGLAGKVLFNDLHLDQLWLHDKEIGYYELGRVEDFPVGHTVYFLRKDLGGAS